MSETAAAGFRSDSAWLAVPYLSEITDPIGWAGEAARLVADAQGFRGDDVAMDRVRFGLGQLVQIDPLPGFLARVLFAPDIQDGSIVFHVTAATARGDSVADQRELLGLDSLGAFNGQLDDLRELGVEGFQLLRVDELPAITPPPGETSDVKVLVAILSTCVRRELPGFGQVDVVAFTQSAELVVVFAAIAPVVDLLLGDDLPALLGGAST